MKKIIPILTFLVILSGCELYEQDEYQEYYVVESYLVANDTLQQVRLSTTNPIDETYRFEDNTVSGATVEIQRLHSDSSVAEQYQYQEQRPGIYTPVDNITIQDEQLYRLQVTTQNGDEISSTTYVPGDFETVNELESSYVYQGEQQVELTTTPSSYITDRQTYFVFTINALDTSLNNLTPFYADQVDDDETDIEEYYVNSSGIVNEGNFDQNPDNGNITLRLPWLAVAFYGSNNIIVNTIDDNLYDFLRSHDTQSGGTTLSPGEIQNIRYNVNGGIGIFGSMASDTSSTFITRP
ncbi:hypothetical protein CK503_12900 [Aliifodinibius salipaludis]|uniref:DUF4249 domain-containing protein n=1 Tax=Fodinibius salipaludis TaxID=2032627 RepID=A0A2A2G8H8_9BACT|nr:DUF4249 family protein [Aliifodinibius salipaludis]PAU93314.1 hypothetical protein CK503_12900 [Aliifodinibius salipaludis]